MQVHSRDDLLKELPLRRERVRELIGEEKAEALSSLHDPIKAKLDILIAAFCDISIDESQSTEIDTNSQRRIIETVRGLRSLKDELQLIFESKWCEDYKPRSHKLLSAAPILAASLGEASLYDPSSVPEILTKIGLFIDEASELTTSLKSDYEEKRITPRELLLHDPDFAEEIRNSTFSRLSGPYSASVLVKARPATDEIIGKAAALIDAAIKEDSNTIENCVKALAKDDLPKVFEAIKFLLLKRDFGAEQKFELFSELVNKVAAAKESLELESISTEAPTEKLVATPDEAKLDESKRIGTLHETREQLTLEEALGLSKPITPEEIITRMLSPYIKNKELFNEVLSDELSKKILFRIFISYIDPSPFHTSFITEFSQCAKPYQVTKALKDIAKSLGRDALSKRQVEKRIPEAQVHLWRIFFLQLPVDQMLLRQFRDYFGVEVPKGPSQITRKTTDPKEGSSLGSTLVVIRGGKKIEFQLPLFDIVPNAPIGTIDDLMAKGLLTEAEYSNLLAIHLETRAKTGIKYGLNHLTPLEVHGLNDAVVQYEAWSPSERAEYLTDFVYRWIPPGQYDFYSEKQKGTIRYSKDRDKDSTPAATYSSRDEELKGIRAFLGIEEPTSGYRNISESRECSLADMVLTPTEDVPRNNRMVHGNRNHRSSEIFFDSHNRTPLALVAERYLAEVVNQTRLDAWLPQAYEAARSVREFHRKQVEPLILRQRELELDPAVIQEMKWRVDYISQTANFYEGEGRESKANYMTWLQVLALKRILFEYETYLRIFVSGLSDFKPLENDFDPLDLNQPTIGVGVSHGKAGGDY